MESDMTRVLTAALIVFGATGAFAQNARPAVEAGVGITAIGAVPYEEFGTASQSLALDFRITVPVTPRFSLEGEATFASGTDALQHRIEGLYLIAVKQRIARATRGRFHAFLSYDIPLDSARRACLGERLGPAASLLDKLTRKQRQHRIAAPQRIDAAVVLGLGKLVSQHSGPQSADFVFVKVPQEVPHQLWLRVIGREDAVPRQRLEHFGSIPKRRRADEAGTVGQISHGAHR
jgi:hypothetical protein